MPKDIQNKAGHRSNALCARILLMEYYFTVYPTPDTSRFALSKFIRHPASQAASSVNVLTNIKWWTTAIQVNFEVTGTMPSQQEMRGAFSKLITPLMLSEPDLKRAHQIIHERLWSQITTEDEVLTYFTQIEERTHALDSPGDSQPKGKSKGGKGRSESAPPPNTNPLSKQDDKKGGKKGAGRGKGPTPMPKPSPRPANQATNRPKASGPPPATAGVA